MMMMRNPGIAKSFFKSFLRRESGPFAARVVVHPNYVHSFALDDDDDEALEKGTTLFLHHALKNNNGRRRRSRGEAVKTTTRKKWYHDATNNKAAARRDDVNDDETLLADGDDDDDEKKTVEEDDTTNETRKKRKEKVSSKTRRKEERHFARREDDDDETLVDDDDDEKTVEDDTTTRKKRKEKVSSKTRRKEERHFADVLLPGLHRFFSRFGHLNVPKSYVDEEDFKFGRVVHNFRAKAARRNAEKSLTRAQRQALDDVGASEGEKFVWDADDFVFDNQIVPGLILFKKKFGHLNVPHKYVVDGDDVVNAGDSDDDPKLRKPYLKDFPLGAKVNDMRAKGTYILHRPKRLETLAELGFVWDDEQFRFEEMLVPAVLAYRELNQRKLAETFVAANASKRGDSGRRPPRKLFGKYFKFRLPWTLVVSEYEKNKEDANGDEHRVAIPEFKSLLRSRPYLDGYALGSVARRSYALSKKTQTQTTRTEKEDTTTGYTKHTYKNKNIFTTETPPKDPKVARAEKIVRKLRVLGVVFDDFEDVTTIQKP